MAEINATRDFQGSLADAQGFYAAAQAQYITSIKGPYELDGRKYDPPPPDVVRNELAYWSNQVLRLQNIQPNAPDVQLIQTTFGPNAGGPAGANGGPWWAGT